MGYADGLLATGERIVHREQQHWFVFVWGARWTILAHHRGDRCCRHRAQRHDRPGHRRDRSGLALS